MLAQKSFLVLFLAQIITLTQQINSTCSHNGDLPSCPTNSFCNSKQYCECKEGWALACNIPSITLSHEPRTVQISQSPVYFTIVPSSTDSIYVYRFQLSTDVRTQFNIELYADEGWQTELNKQNLIGFLGLQTSSQPIPLFSPYMEFGEQSNGRIEQMILKIQPLNIRLSGNLRRVQQKQSNIFKETKKINLKINVQQIFFLNKTTLFAIILSFISFISLSLLCGIAYCIYVIRRGPRRFLDNNIKYFDKLIPKRKIQANEEILEASCPVCLIDFKQKDQIRETPCKHVFHPECLDLWCKKKLTCPACRSNLSKSHIEQQLRKNEMQVLLTKFSSNTTVDIQELEWTERGQSLREPLSVN